MVVSYMIFLFFISLIPRLNSLLNTFQSLNSPPCLHISYTVLSSNTLLMTPQIVLSYYHGFFLIVHMENRNLEIQHKG